MGPREPAGAVQLEFPEAAQPARPGDRRRHALRGRWSTAGRKHVIRTKLASEDPTVPGARTFEAQLDDGHWLQISERRTKDGGYVSVGTDITPLKQHEKKLMDSEQRLMATVADLRQSQHKLEIAGQQLTDLAREIRRGENPRRGGQPGQVQVPRQHEPRAAHAAQRHHRLLRDHGIGNVRRARRRQVSRILPRHPRQRRNTCSTSSTTSSTCRRSRPAGSSSTSRTSSSTASWPTRCASSPRARRTSSCKVTSKIAPDIRLKADRRALKQIALNLLSNAVKFTPEKRPHHRARPRVARRRGDRHPGFRHRHRARRAARSSAGRSSRSKASSPRPSTARAWASPSPNRWSSCMAA